MVINLNKKEIQDILKKMRFNCTDKGSSIMLEVNWEGMASEIEICHKTGKYNPIWKKANKKSLFNFTKSPTGNCQMMSISQFKGHLDPISRTEREKIYLKSIKNIAKNYKIIEITKYKIYNNKIETLALIAAFAYMNYRVTAKHLVFIDIRQEGISSLDIFNKFLFKKRDKTKDHKYISTNKSKMMYTVLEIDKRKIKKIKDIMFN